MLHGSIIERFAEAACNVGTSRATRGWDALLIDQLRYDFLRFQEGIRIQELAPPEEIPIDLAELCLIAYQRASAA